MRIHGAHREMEGENLAPVRKLRFQVRHWVVEQIQVVPKPVPATADPVRKGLEDLSGSDPFGLRSDCILAACVFGWALNCSSSLLVPAGRAAFRRQIQFPRLVP